MGFCRNRQAKSAGQKGLRYTQSDPMSDPCRHPRVQVVSREEDAEYVECLVCREVFESSEFRDMEIEEKIPIEEE